MLLAEVLDQVAHLANLIGIEADGRLVENQQIRFVHERVRQADALPVTFGKRADDPIFHVAQTAQSSFTSPSRSLQAAARARP